VERGRAPSLHVVELDDTGNFTPDQAARLETFIYDADDTGPDFGPGIAWVVLIASIVGAGLFIYALAHGVLWFWSAVT
jgi:hypothetical protein